jgi:hypothetical protein
MRATEMNEKFKSGCRVKKNRQPEGERKFNRDLLKGDWEVFVVKRDKATGKLVGKPACCALAPV